MPSFCIKLTPAPERALPPSQLCLPINKDGLCRLFEYVPALPFVTVDLVDVHHCVTKLLKFSCFVCAMQCARC